jgi:hypothetical protein
VRYSSKIEGEKTLSGFLTGKLYSTPKSKFSNDSPIDIPILFKFNDPTLDICWLTPIENSPN